MLCLRDAFLSSLSTSCITNTEPEKKTRVKSLHLSSDPAGKTEDVTMMIVLYRSCSQEKHLLDINTHTVVFAHSRFTVVNGLLHPIATHSVREFVSL